MIRFHIACIPPKSTAQAGLCILKRRDGTQFVGRMEKSKSQRAKNDLMALFAEHRPPQPLAGPLLVRLEWTYPWRKSEPKKNRVTGRKLVDTRPDADNIFKFVADVMTRLGFWLDDAQVHPCILRYWGDEPGIDVWVLPLVSHAPDCAIALNGRHACSCMPNKALRRSGAEARDA